MPDIGMTLEFSYGWLAIVSVELGVFGGLVEWTVPL